MHAATLLLRYCCALSRRYERRKLAALEVEQRVKQLAAAGDDARVREIIRRLITEYASSQQANHRKVRPQQTFSHRPLTQLVTQGRGGFMHGHGVQPQAALHAATPS